MENVRSNPLTRRFATMLMATLFAAAVLAGSVAGGSAQDDRAVKGAGTLRRVRLRSASGASANSEPDAGGRPPKEVAM